MTIDDMITHITNNDLTKANDAFNSLLQDKMNIAMEQEKIAVASTIFNGTEEPDEEQLEMDFDEEDLEVDEDEDEEYDDEELEDESE